MAISTSCDGVTHVLPTLLRTVSPTYSIYSSSSERATHTSMWSTAQNGTERVTCKTGAVVAAAVIELRMSCQRCYNTCGMYHVQYLQLLLLAVLSFYAATLWAIACVRFSFPVNKRTLQRLFRSKMRERCAHTSHFSPSAFHISLENHEGCWRCFSFPTLESFPHQPCVYVFPTFSSPVSARCAWVLKTIQRKLWAFTTQHFPARTLGITSL